MKLTAEQVRYAVRYDKDTGDFTSRFSGRTLGIKHSAGYLQIWVLGSKHLAHRLAWLYVYGEWPLNIDHIDGTRTNNAIANLRNVTKSVNSQNMTIAMSNNRSGCLGASFCKRTGKWMAQIRLPRGKKIHLGRFNTPDEAHSAYVTEKRKLHEGNTL